MSILPRNGNLPKISRESNECFQDNMPLFVQVGISTFKCAIVKVMMRIAAKQINQIILVKIGLDDRFERARTKLVFERGLCDFTVVASIEGV